MRIRKPKAVSLFTGAGGLDIGLKYAGFEIKACLELERWACDTLRANNPETIVVGPPDYSGDITQITPKEFMEIVDIKPNEIDLIVGGPPCQPFSIAANQRFKKEDERFKRIGFNDTRRGDLLKYYVDYVCSFKPKAFLLENVPGLRDIDEGKFLQNQLAKLSDEGYYISEPTVLNSVNFGVPQLRERLFIIGIRGIDKKPRLPLSGEEVGSFWAKFHVVAHALTNISDDLANHVTRNHKEASLRRYRALAFGKREHLGRVDRLDPRKPAKTVISGGTSGGGRSHLHPYLARTLTVRECARLQTFPDDYIFSGTIGRQFTQVGNAVPPMLSAALGCYMMKHYFGHDELPNNPPVPYLSGDNNVEYLCQILKEKSLANSPELVYYDLLGTSESSKEQLSITFDFEPVR
jgi:DNA (cytosine-5)-methyltransferase 1